MKKIIFLILIFLSTQIFSQGITKENCDGYLKQTGLKYLECIYKFEKTDSKDKIYQF